MQLIKNNLSLYFCTALFFHIALISAIYNWSDKNSAGTQQATSVTTYFSLSPAPSPMGNGRGEEKTSEASLNPILNTTNKQKYQQNGYTLPLPSPISHGRGGRGEGSQHTPEHHGYSKLLALLHTNIQEKQIYPLEAIMSQQSGTAIVDFTLLPNGNIVNSTLHESSGYSDLDQAALAAVQAISPFKAIAVNARQNFDVAVSFSLS